MNNRIPVIALLGPTAIGKSKIALELYDQYPIEIVSVDSAMIYKDMDIGTDKPTHEVLASKKHHLIDIRNPNQNYNVGDFYSDVNSIITEIHSNGKVPLLVGGSMMYFNRLFKGLSQIPGRSISDRKLINHLNNFYTSTQLHECLKHFDKKSFNNINKNDKQRIERAIEVYMSSGKPITSFFNKTNLLEVNYKFINIKLTISSRKDIHEKISYRVQQMFKKGLIDEVIYVRDKYSLSKESQSMKSIGYRHVLEYLETKETVNDLQNKCLFATRQLAKRQHTWLKQFTDVIDIDISTNKTDKLKQIIDNYLQFI